MGITGAVGIMEDTDIIEEYEHHGGHQPLGPVRWEMSPVLGWALALA